MSQQELSAWGQTFLAELDKTERLLRGFEGELVRLGLLTEERAASWPN